MFELREKSSTKQHMRFNDHLSKIIHTHRNLDFVPNKNGLYFDLEQKKKFLLELSSTAPVHNVCNILD